MSDLAFPGATFSDLFSEHRLCQIACPMPLSPFPSLPLGNRKRKGSKIGSYLATNAGHPSAHVRPSPDLVTFLRANMIDVDYDSIYFRAIHRGDGTTLVIAQYNQIIGSRWLALLQTSDLPADLRPIQGEPL